MADRYRMDSGSGEVQNSIREDPLDRNRKATNPIVIAIIVIVFLTWFSVVCYAFPGDNVPRNQGQSTFPYLWEFFDIGMSLTATIISLNVIALLLFLLFLKYAPKFCTIVMMITIGILILLLVICFGSICYLLIVLECYGKLLLFSITMVTFAFIYEVIVLLSVKKVGVSKVTNIIRRTLSGFSSNLYLIPCLFIIMLVELFVILFTLAPLVSGGGSNVALSFFSLFLSYYLYSFIACNARMIISAVIATWYRTENKLDVPKSLIFKSTNIITRHHFGTAAIAALPLFPFIFTLVAACRHKRTAQNTLDRFAYFFLVLNIIFGNIEYSTIVSSIHGLSFYQSTRKTFDLLTRSCCLSLGHMEIFRGMLGLKMSFASLITFSVITYHQIPYRSADELDELMRMGMFFALLFTLPVLELLSIISRINFFCLMEDEEEQDLSYRNGQEMTMHEEIPGRY